MFVLDEADEMLMLGGLGDQSKRIRLKLRKDVQVRWLPARRAHRDIALFSNCFILKSVWAYSLACMQAAGLSRRSGQPLWSFLAHALLWYAVRFAATAQLS
jgi:hypothetical protein